MISSASMGSKAPIEPAASKEGRPYLKAVLTKEDFVAVGTAAAAAFAKASPSKRDPACFNSFA